MTGLCGIRPQACFFITAATGLGLITVGIDEKNHYTRRLFGRDRLTQLEQVCKYNRALAQ